MKWSVPLAALGGGIFLQIALDAKECNWCDRGPNGEDTLNGLDRGSRTHLLWPAGGRHTAAYVSDAAAGTMAVLPYLLLKPTGHQAETIQTFIWVFAIDAAGVAIPKRLFARERPLVHFDDTAAKQDSQPNASFPSNHTSRSFASVFAAARVCEITDCPHAGRIWLIGLPLASATGLLRIGADKHYMTDVLAGAGFGAAIGWYTPALTRKLAGHNRAAGSSEISIRPLVGSQIGLTLDWAWQ